MNILQYLHGGKNSKLLYFTYGIRLYIIPKCFLRTKLQSILSSIENRDDKEYILNRVNYYCKLSEQVKEPKYIQSAKLLQPIQLAYLSNFKLKGNRSTYFLDTLEFTRWFKSSYKISYLFGDVVTVPQIPTIVKSRPIITENSNSVLLNLDKIRHFVFLNDKCSFVSKKDILFFRADLKDKPNRIKFMEMYFNNPMCDLGEVSASKYLNKEWKKSKITLLSHLKYKFILALEGNDVASNLKWIMSSNSIAVMPTPKYETWFMEGCLIPNVHYIEIKEDYSDLIEKLNYYITHPDSAKQIIESANNYVAQFKNKKREKLISLLVLQKYFKEN
ncbi:MAG: glycosyl transferase family 90 [Bacteroidales bacterium]